MSATTASRPDLNRGDRVAVEEPGLPEWEGSVLSVKPGASAWHVEIRRDDGIAFVVVAQHVRGLR